MTKRERKTNDPVIPTNPTTNITGNFFLIHINSHILKFWHNASRDATNARSFWKQKPSTAVVYPLEGKWSWTAYCSSIIADNVSNFNSDQRRANYGARTSNPIYGRQHTSRVSRWSSVCIFAKLGHSLICKFSGKFQMNFSSFRTHLHRSIKTIWTRWKETPHR